MNDRHDDRAQQRVRPWAIHSLSRALRTLRLDTTGACLWKIALRLQASAVNGPNADKIGSPTVFRRYVCGVWEVHF